ncbi:hypothetical protein T265_05045 [Opisthorchis viverrini]|uniref:Peptidase C13 family protein n=1 Tax=Opisthorchis viverrini TaxID=6198 RepID=A0A074ZXB6_OPIVI|nr:hypothetical protein T265_05045 [Opisthorchis viverrini]KER27995.1 hypothetical protein T265_05045 [Opisthorchis viverrini]
MSTILSRNPFKGQVFNDYEHEDFYKGVVIDYRGKNPSDHFNHQLDKTVYVTMGLLQLMTKPIFLGNITIEIPFPRLFCALLCARVPPDKLLSKTILTFPFNSSGPDDNVFIYYTGHGSRYYIIFPDEELTVVELNNIFAHLRSKKKYNKLVFYMDACFSGSMFGSLPSNVGIYATTSAKEDEDSYAVHCDDKQIDVCLATEYSYAWITDSEYVSFIKNVADEPVSLDSKPSSWVHLISMSRRLMEATTVEEHEAAWRKLHRALQLGHIVKETFHDIVMDVTSHHKPTVKGLSTRNELMCFKAVFDHFRTHCFTIQQATSVQHWCYAVVDDDDEYEDDDDDDDKGGDYDDMP